MERTDVLIGVCAALKALSREALQQTEDMLFSAWKRGATIFALGNGGSAAIADHLVCDLTKWTQHSERPRLRAVAVTSHTALLTAWANDESYEAAFVETLRGMWRKGDVLVAISASGRSENVVRAARFAKGSGCVVALCGFGGGELASVADVAVVVPSDHYGVVEAAISAVCHDLAERLRVRCATT